MGYIAGAFRGGTYLPVPFCGGVCIRELDTLPYLYRQGVVPDPAGFVFRAGAYRATFYCGNMEAEEN